MKTIKLLILALSLTAASFNAISAGAKIDLDHANTDIMDRASLQNGAKLFMNYCSGCHAISFMRYNRIGNDLGLSDELVAQNLMFAGSKPGEAMVTAMPENAASKWFGGVPPDLSLVARSKGTDWITPTLEASMKTSQEYSESTTRCLLMHQCLMHSGL